MLKPRERPMVPLTVRLRAQWRERLDRIQKRQGFNRGDIVRVFLDEKGFTEWLKALDSKSGTT
jgi:hypothetical protein